MRILTTFGSTLFLHLLDQLIDESCSTISAAKKNETMKLRLQKLPRDGK